MDESFSVERGTVRISRENESQLISLRLGVTKYDVSASADEEKERIDEWHRYLNEDGDEES